MQTAQPRPEVQQASRYVRAAAGQGFAKSHESGWSADVLWGVGRQDRFCRNDGRAGATCHRDVRNDEAEYVPTQVVTEYLRSALTGDESLDGVIYSSVKNKGGRCVVLFADRDAVDPASPRSASARANYLLTMESVDHFK
jgi:hypothetical protein